MRDCAQFRPRFWTDEFGREWREPEIIGRLKFRIRSHAALRAFVFRRDGFACVKCSKRVSEPHGHDYDGRESLFVEGGGCLVADHVVSRRNGGRHHPDNMQARCGSCNARKASLVDSKGARA